MPKLIIVNDPGAVPTGIIYLQLSNSSSGGEPPAPAQLAIYDVRAGYAEGSSPPVTLPVVPAGALVVAFFRSNCEASAPADCAISSPHLTFTAGPQGYHAWWHFVDVHVAVNGAAALADELISAAWSGNTGGRALIVYVITGGTAGTGVVQAAAAYGTEVPASISVASGSLVLGMFTTQWNTAITGDATVDYYNITASVLVDHKQAPAAGNVDMSVTLGAAGYGSYILLPVDQKA